MKDRDLTPDTKWIICMWDIKGDDAKDTAKFLKRSLAQVTSIIDECKANGYYDMVRRHIEHFEIVNARRAIENFASILRGPQGVTEYEQ